jgi:hypothetical protein
LKAAAASRRRRASAGGSVTTIQPASISIIVAVSALHVRSSSGRTQLEESRGSRKAAATSS